MAKSRKTTWVFKHRSPLVVGFVVGFGLFGLITLLQSYAAPKNSGGSCVMNPNPISIGANYSGTATGLPKNSVLNIYTTYGDGTTWNYVYGTTPDGNMTIGGYPATISGTTTFKVTGPTKSNSKQTPVYATCAVEVTK